MGKAGEPLLLCHLVQFNVQLRLQTIVTGLKNKIHHPSVDFYLMSSVITMWSQNNKTVLVSGAFDFNDLKIIRLWFCLSIG